MTRSSCVFVFGERKSPVIIIQHIKVSSCTDRKLVIAIVEWKLYAGVYSCLTSHLMEVHLQAMRLIHSCFCLTYWFPCPFCLRAASCLVCISAYICAKQLHWICGPECIESRSFAPSPHNQIARGFFCERLPSRIKVASGRNSNMKAWRDNAF